MSPVVRASLQLRRDLFYLMVTFHCLPGSNGNVRLAHKFKITRLSVCTITQNTVSK